MNEGPAGVMDYLAGPLALSALSPHGGAEGGATMRYKRTRGRGVNDRYISGTRILAGCAWGLVLGLMAGAGAVLALTDEWRWAGLLAASSCATSAVAATITIKGYATRLCSLIRVTSGLEREGEVRSLHTLR